MAPVIEDVANLRKLFASKRNKYFKYTIEEMLKISIDPTEAWGVADDVIACQLKATAILFSRIQKRQEERSKLSTGDPYPCLAIRSPSWAYQSLPNQIPRERSGWIHVQSQSSEDVRRQ